MFGKTLPLETAYDSLAPGYGERIQAGAVFCDDGSCRVYRVRRDRVLREARRARAHSGGTAGVLDRRESRRASGARCKIAHAAAMNMMAQKYFEQHGSSNKQDWDLAFEHGYEDGFRKTHPQE